MGCVYNMVAAKTASSLFAWYAVPTRLNFLWGVPNRVIASSRAWNLPSTKDKYGAPGHRFRCIFAWRSSAASCANSVAINCSLELSEFLFKFESLVVLLPPEGRTDHMAEGVFRHLSQLSGIMFGK